MIRQPLVVVMGNIDSGKTRTLDTIRRTAVTAAEAGAITQMISSSSISFKTLQRVTGDLLKKQNITIPGLIFLDTPGHAAFSNMRKRGGNLADIAILVIDVNEGIKPQTKECLNILKKYKTPFIISLNKFDLVPGFQDNKEKAILQIFNKQAQSVQQNFETKLYEIVGELYQLGFEAERFDRVEDYTKQIAMVPCSGKFGQGIPELLAVLTGLAQKYLEKNLEINADAPGKGTVLEVKDEKGTGVALDTIIYEGKIKVNDTIVVGGLHEPIVTKIRGLFLPDEKNKYKAVKEVVGAAGVKIVAPGIKEVVSGMPIYVATGNEEEIKQKIMEEIDEVVIETENEGVVVKADSLGSLEAAVGMLQELEIPIKKGSVGNITKKDLVDAESNPNELNRVIMCFNTDGKAPDSIKVLKSPVIYKLIEELEKFRIEKQKEIESRSLKDLTKPAKIKVLRGCMFRQSNPCVVGVEVMKGVLTPDTELIKMDGSKVGHIKTVQLEKESVKQAEKDKQVAISLPGITGGRQINEDDILIIDIKEKEFKNYKRLRKLLSPEQAELLREIAEIKRKENPVWGV
jgi:translation initiation factor 5B